MALLKMLKTLILICLLSYAICEDPCDDEIDDPAKAFQNDPSTDPPDEDEVKQAIEKLDSDQKKLLKADTTTAEAIAKIPVSPWIIPPPNPESLCDSEFRQLRIGRTIWLNGNRCYVLRPWWNQLFTAITYATCRPQPCKNLPQCHWFPYRYRCYGTNRKLFNLWVLCPTFPRIRRLRLNLAQCCECHRYRLPWILHDDFTPAIPANPAV